MTRKFPDRDKAILDGWADGAEFIELSHKHCLSRERIRQIVSYKVLETAGYGMHDRVLYRIWVRGGMDAVTAYLKEER